jgi:hypothetical protein
VLQEELVESDKHLLAVKRRRVAEGLECLGRDINGLASVLDSHVGNRTDHLAAGGVGDVETGPIRGLDELAIDDARLDEEGGVIETELRKVSEDFNLVGRSGDDRHELSSCGSDAQPSTQHRLSLDITTPSQQIVLTGFSLLIVVGQLLMARMWEGDGWEREGRAARWSARLAEL